MIGPRGGFCQNLQNKLYFGKILRFFAVFFGLNMRYDISSADEATRRAGVQYLKDIVRKIAVQGGELFSGVTFAGWGVPKEFVDEAKKRALLH